jgi:solute carrier family 30 (zinc transporter), member 9
VYDSVGSILIGGLLGAVAIFLIRKNRDMLVGRAIPQEVTEQITNARRLRPLLSRATIRFSFLLFG